MSSIYGSANDQKHGNTFVYLCVHGRKPRTCFPCAIAEAIARNSPATLDPDISVLLEPDESQDYSNIPQRFFPPAQPLYHSGSGTYGSSYHNTQDFTRFQAVDDFGQPNNQYTLLESDTRPNFLQHTLPADFPLSQAYGSRDNNLSNVSQFFLPMDPVSRQNTLLYSLEDRGCNMSTQIIPPADPSIVGGEGSHHKDCPPNQSKLTVLTNFTNCQSRKRRLEDDSSQVFAKPTSLTNDSNQRTREFSVEDNRPQIFFQPLALKDFRGRQNNKNIPGNDITQRLVQLTPLKNSSGRYNCKRIHDDDDMDPYFQPLRRYDRFDLVLRSGPPNKRLKRTTRYSEPSFAVNYPNRGPVDAAIREQHGHFIDAAAAHEDMLWEDEMEEEGMFPLAHWLKVGYITLLALLLAVCYFALLVVLMHAMLVFVDAHSSP